MTNSLVIIAVMARTRTTPPTADDAMRWLLRFADADLPSLDRRALRQMALDVLRTPHADASGVEHSALTSAMVAEVHGDDATFPRGTLKALAPLQREVRDALKRLAAGKSWAWPVRPRKIGLVPARADVGEHDAGRATDASRHLVRRTHGSFEASFYASVDGILFAGWERVRVCAAPTCKPKRLFVPADPRQRYCSPECLRRTTWEKFAPTRKRDYKAEYDQRIAKRHGPKVKARHRSR
jgi:hypothetical protein